MFEICVFIPPQVHQILAKAKFIDDCFFVNYGRYRSLKSCYGSLQIFLHCMLRLLCELCGLNFSTAEFAKSAQSSQSHSPAQLFGFFFVSFAHSPRTLVRDEAHSNQWVKIPSWQFAVHHEVMGRSWLVTVMAKLPYQFAFRRRDGKQAARCGLVTRKPAIDDPAGDVGSLPLSVL